MDRELLERLRDMAYETGWAAGQAEAGVIAARREGGAAILSCGHHASNAVMGEEGATCQMCNLEAQAALMGEALKEIKDATLGCNKPGYDWVYLRRIELLADEALSAAPRVLWSEMVELVPSEKKNWPALYMYAVGSEADSYSESGEYRGELMGYPEDMGGMVRFIVLEYPRHPEQAQSSEQEA